ncbi:MAG: ferrous iron transport protein B [Deltaproteobacteria bacterium]|jgi:ferrous iron transport protein B|nr:ferrous iron transport protein B [Deltaproteobacteria bacterium]
MQEDSRRIAIAGNPNSGKTTAFNRYTGARQHVGNYPGITVEKKEGIAHLDGIEITLVDLPGTYSLTAYSLEEVVARRVLSEETPAPGAVIDVINSGVLERNLYLSVQLLELGMPLVLALNMMDEAKANGLDINVERLAELTGLKCVPMVARKGQGLDDALRAAVELAKETGGKVKPLEISYGADVDLALKEMIPLIEDAKLLTANYPSRWLAMKFLERDEEITRRAEEINPEVCKKLKDRCETLSAHLKATLKTYPEAVIADYRYGWIHSILKNGVLKSADEIAPDDRVAFSDKVDTIVTQKVLGPVILFAILYVMYYVTIEIGAIPNDWVAGFFDWLGGVIGDNMGDGPLKSLLVDGIIAGVGGVLGFVPLIMIMFLFISVLEDSGYMARVAYIMDRVFRFFGLHGASIMPFIISGGIAGGCAVPGVMATRTLRSPKERLATILTAPFMTCGAKIPVFLLFVNIFFEAHRPLVMFSITICGWVAALLVSWLLRNTIIRGAATPFVMELPPYRYPTFSGVVIHTWERTWQYIKKAGTVILAISILIWAAMTYPTPSPESETQFEEQRTAIEAQKEAGTLSEEDFEAQGLEVDNQEQQLHLRNSIAGRLGTAMEVITKPAGFNWQTNIALIGGIAAKEVVISTLGTAYSLGSVDPEEDTSLADRIKDDPEWTLANAVSLMVFTLLYSPCFVTLMMIKQETARWRWLFFSLFFNLAFAMVLSIVAFQLLS